MFGTFEWLHAPPYCKENLECQNQLEWRFLFLCGSGENRIVVFLVVTYTQFPSQLCTDLIELLKTAILVS